MGMNKQNSADIQKGFKMLGELVNLAGSSETGTDIDYSGDFEERARMMELDAQERAYAQKLQNDKQARQTHANLESERAKNNTKWGQSGLAMGGSKELIRTARQLEDRQLEEDELFEAEMEENMTMNQGRREANLYRIERGISPRRSTLSLGSSIYKYGR